MKYIVNFFKGLAVFILTWIMFISLICLTTMSSTEYLLKEDLVKQFVMDIDINKLLSANDTKELNSLFEKSGVPEEYVSYVLNNEDVKEYVGDYASSVVDYVLYEKDLPKVDEQKLTEILTKSFDIVVDEINKGNIKVDHKVTEKEIKKVHSTIKDYVPKIAKEFPDAKEIIDEEDKDNASYQDARKNIKMFTNYMDNTKDIYNHKYVLIITVIVCGIFIVLLRLANYRFLSSLKSPFVSAGIFLLILVLGIETIVKSFFPQDLEFIRPFFDNNIGKISSVWRRDMFIYLGIAIALVVARLIISIVHNKKENNEFSHIEKDYEDAKENESEHLEEQEESEDIEQAEESAEENDSQSEEE